MKQLLMADFQLQLSTAAVEQTVAKKRNKHPVATDSTSLLPLSIDGVEMVRNPQR
jgi:hypothetical protein